MNSLKRSLLGILLTFLTLPAIAQIEITFPSNRAVFQRNNGNVSLIHISGHYRQIVDRVDAQFVPIQGGAATGWITIDNAPNAGNYNGAIVVGGGWYRLEVRGLRHGEVLFSSQVDRVGVGEVFLISGQSNAQGYHNYGQPRANDDRVSVISNFYSLSGQKPLYPTFSHLEAESKIAPTGNGAWCWGRLGDLITQKLNVPVLFMNAAWEGFEVSQFYSSSRGGSGRNPYSGNVAPQGYPYSSISDALHYYINMLGIRSVLWHQGESDNFLRTPSEQYRAHLQDLINQSRNSSGKNITWMVARASRDQNGSWQPVIDGQNGAIQSTPNVFFGPNTDLINDRWDGVHFAGEGLERLAQAWSNSLDFNFFAASVPQMGNGPLNVQKSCDPNSNPGSPVKLTAPQGFRAYEWSNGSNATDAWFGTGTHQGKAFDHRGNVFFTTPHRFPADMVPAKPSISAQGPTEFCRGGSVNLVVEGDGNNIYWNTNQSGSNIRVSQQGTYVATAVNFYSCGNQSNPIQVNNLPTPQPQITASGPTNICSDEELQLEVNYTDNIQWNNGRRDPRLNITQPGTYSVTATNQFGCTGYSNEVNVIIRQAAEKPTVVNTGLNEFCQDDSTVLVASNFRNLSWSNGSTGESIPIKSTGTYFAINENEEGCRANSEPINIQVNPRPEKPTITANGPLTFCDDTSVTLSAPQATKYNWSDGSLSQSIEVSQSANLLLRVENEFACVSPISEPVSINALATPRDPRVLQTGTFTLSASFSSNIDQVQYLWQINGDTLIADQPAIKARNNGTYKVKGFREYEIENGQTLTCESKLSEGMQYEIDASQNGFSVYPNPSLNELVKIETLEDVDNATVTLYDLTGRLIRTFSVPVFDSVKSFDLTGVSKGSYIVKIKNNRSKFTSKLIVR